MVTCIAQVITAHDVRISLELIDVAPCYYREGGGKNNSGAVPNTMLGVEPEQLWHVIVFPRWTFIVVLLV